VVTSCTTSTTSARGDEAVARASKHRFALSDTYGIEVEQGEDEGLVLAVAVALDEMAHDSDGGDD
jgi:uncharacterized protein YxjI